MSLRCAAPALFQCTAAFTAGWLALAPSSARANYGVASAAGTCTNQTYCTLSAVVAASVAGDIIFVGGVSSPIVESVQTNIVDGRTFVPAYDATAAQNCAQYFGTENGGRATIETSSQTHRLVQLGDAVAPSLFTFDHIEITTDATDGPFVGSGGMIAMVNQVTLMLWSSRVANGHAQNGGCIDGASSNVLMNDESTVTGCRAVDDGGGIRLDGTNASQSHPASNTSTSPVKIECIVGDTVRIECESPTQRVEYVREIEPGNRRVYCEDCDVDFDVADEDMTIICEIDRP